MKWPEKNCQRKKQSYAERVRKPKSLAFSGRKKITHPIRAVFFELPQIAKFGVIKECTKKPQENNDAFTHCHHKTFCKIILCGGAILPASEGEDPVCRA